MNYKLTFLLYLLLSVVCNSYAQLDHIHYLPPLKQTSNEGGFIEQEIYFSTPETTPFSVNIYRGSNPTPIRVITNLSNNNPKSYNPGNADNNITLVTNANTGIVLSNSGLHFESSNGAIFYANYRGRNSLQAGSLTCKGQAALGTEFRWGGLPNRSSKYDQVSTSLGIMATQDNTEIIISEYDPNCKFRLQNDPDGITSNSISKTLQKGESFVLEALPGESTANIDGWIGAKILSNLPIALSNGALNVGVVSGSGSRDVGIDQPIPVNLLGKKHVFIRGKGADNTEFPLIVAYKDNTEVYVGGSLYATLNDGDYVEVTGDNYSSTNPGANMYVSSSKSVYAYQCITGQDGSASDKTIGMNYVAPLNCLLPQDLNQVSSIDRIAGLNSDESAITIIASSSIPDSDIQVNDLNGPVTLPVGSPVAGTSEWKTFYVTNLKGNVDVTATGPIAVGTFMRHGTFAGLAGYFSGFDTAPDLEIISRIGHCLSGIYLSTNSTVYESYQWFYENTLIPGETSSSITPSQSGEYSVQISQGLCTILSDNFTVNSCPTNIDFDGVDDYLETPSLLSNLTDFSTMAWVKLDPSFSHKGFLFGEDNTSLSINSDKSLTATVKTDLRNYTFRTNEHVPAGEWVHIAYTYDGSQTHIYINGSEATSLNTAGSQLISSNTDFSLGKNPMGNIEYINANIQELRVYNKALTPTQLQEQVYQRILYNNGEVQGEMTLHNIEGLVWSDLILYLKMLSVSGTGTTPDSSSSNQEGDLYNIFTQQTTTAPLPYVANNNEYEDKWSAVSAWQYGNVWDIPSKDWAIVKVTNSAKLITENSHTLLGAIVDIGSELSVQDANYITDIESGQSLTVTKYLKLDGHLDLVSGSQLIQTTGSTFEPASLGYLERDQQGKSKIYSYNYWSSPVYPTISSFNNALYSVSSILKSGIDADNPLDINFTSAGYDGSTDGEIMTVADYWIWKYTSQPDAYANWQHIRSTGEIKPGEGYTMKGTGAGIQNYVFTGKPTNGTIQHTINGGDIYLLGNPYASALDANQFIDDNIITVDDEGDIATGVGASNGALYFWEHFTTNNSHILAQYEGGYSTYNKLGGVIAVADAGVSSNGTASIRPGRYVPVGQGFFVKATPAGGVVEFNNAQRVFKIESAIPSDLDDLDYSIFTRNSNTNIPIESPDIEENISSNIQRLYFKFTNTDGFQRELLLGIKEGLVDGLNYGYDAMLLDNFISDCSWLLNQQSEENLVIQGIGSVYDNLQLPLHIKADKTGNFKFEVIDLSDIDSSTSVYLYDKELDSSFPLEAGVPVEFYLEEGEYSDRFKVVFKVAKIEEVVIVPENIITADNLVVFYNTKTQSIDITNTTQFSAKNIAIHNVLGQQVVKMTTEFKDQNLITIPVSLATGAYVITFDYDNKRQVTKKLMIR